MLQEGDYRQPAIGTSRNRKGGISYRGRLSDPDKCLHIIAGKLLGCKAAALARS